MSRLVRLYPTSWRRRYGAELVDILQQRPMTPRLTFDLIRGAADAHLHPTMIGGDPQPWTHRIPGSLATAAGLIWSSSFLPALWTNADQDWGDGPGIAVMLMFISVPGDYMAAYGRRIGAGIAAAVAVILLAWMLPWTISDGLLNMAAGGTGYLFLGTGMLALAAVRAGIGPATRWIIVAGTVLVPAALGIPVLMGLSPGGPGPITVLAVLLPFGVGWTFIGLRMTLRGAVTLADVPDHPLTREVSAA